MKRTTFLISLALALKPDGFSSLSESQKNFFQEFKEAITSHPVYEDDWLEGQGMETQPEPRIFELEDLDADEVSLFRLEFEPPLLIPEVRDIRLLRLSGDVAGLRGDEDRVTVMVINPFGPPVDFLSDLPHNLRQSPYVKTVEEFERLAKEDEFTFLSRMASVVPRDLDTAVTISAKVESLLFLALKPIVFYPSESGVLRYYRGSDRRVLISVPGVISDHPEKGTIGGWAVVSIEGYPRSFCFQILQREGDAKDATALLLSLAAHTRVSAKRTEEEAVEQGERGNSE